MVWFLMGFILTLVFIIKEYKYLDILDYPIAFLIGMFLTTITWVVASLIVTCAVVDDGLMWEVSSNGINWKTLSECKLEPINDSEYVESIIVDEEMCCRVQLKQSGIVVTKLCDVENTIIQEGDEATIKEQTARFESPILRAIFVPMIDNRYVVTIPSE